MTFTTRDLKDYLNISQTQLLAVAKRAGVRLKKSANGYYYQPLSPKQAARILEAHLRSRRR